MCSEYKRTCTLCVHFHGRNQPRARWLVPGRSTIDHKSRRACQGLCRCCQGSSKHRVILLSLAVCYLSFPWFGRDSQGCVGGGAGIWIAEKWDNLVVFGIGGINWIWGVMQRVPESRSHVFPALWLREITSICWVSNFFHWKMGLMFVSYWIVKML